MLVAEKEYTWIKTTACSYQIWKIAVGTLSSSLPMDWRESHHSDTEAFLKATITAFAKR